VPTTYPKATPTEVMGLLVLLKDHRGAEDLARLADDLDLEIDEILPASDWAEALRLVKVDDGRMTFTDVGRRLVEATIRERKNLLREQLAKTTLFGTLLRALERARGGRMSEEEINRLIAFTAAPGDEAELNIINWGRYSELFRYNPEEHVVTLIRHRSPRGPGGVNRGPPPGAVPQGNPASPSSPGSVDGPDPAARALPVFI
jgi:NitT/TauT family transport system ATP-binding protein